MSVWFSPNGGCEAQIVSTLGSTTGAVYGLIFMYQSELIHNKLIAVKGLGRTVELIFDRRQQFLIGPRLDELLAAGIPCYYDKFERSVRSQYLALSPRYVFAGSYIYTSQSELRYAEILMLSSVTNDYTLTKANWDFHKAHSELIT